MKNKQLLIILLSYLFISTEFFQYSRINHTLIGRVQLLVSIVLILFCYFHKNRVKITENKPFGRLIKYFYVVPLLSILGILTLYGEGIEWELRFSLLMSSISFYAVFTMFHVDEKCIVRSLVIFALIGFCIQVFQQFYPENALFGISSDDTLFHGDIAEKRNNLYRFRIGSSFITLFALYYYWEKWLIKKSIKNSILLVSFLVSIYLYLTRQTIFATVVTLVLSSLFLQPRVGRKNKVMIIASVVLLVGVIYYYSDTLFGALVNQTQQESMEDNIRTVCLAFYWDKVTDNPISFLFGSGFPSVLSIWKSNGLYPSDIGFVGEWFHHGIFQILLYFYFLYLSLIKYRKVIPNYILMFIFGTACTSPMIFPYMNSTGYLILGIVLYISDLYIEKDNKRN